MTALTIKNIPDKLYEILKKQAAYHRRSINNEVIVYLERILLGKEENSVASVLINNAKKLRKKTKAYHLTEAMLRDIKGEGRS